MKTRMKPDALEQMRDELALAEQSAKERRTEWDRNLPPLTVARVGAPRYGGIDNLLVRLKLGDDHVDLKVPREAWGHWCLEPGAQWSLVPGHRPDPYTATVAAARQALLRAEGDLHALPPDQQDLLRETESPWAWDTELEPQDITADAF